MRSCTAVLPFLLFVVPCLATDTPVIADTTTVYVQPVPCCQAPCFGTCDLNPSYNHYTAPSGFTISKITVNYHNDGTGNNCDGFGNYGAIISTTGDASGTIATSTNSVYMGCIYASGSAEFDFTGQAIPASFYLDFAAFDGVVQGGSEVVVYDVSVYANVVASPSAVLSTHNLAFGFGVVLRGSQTPLVEIPSATASLTVTNEGSSALTFPTNAFSFSSSDFVLGTGPNPCSSNSPVMPGSGCTVYVTFNPQASAPRAASLTINTNDPAGPQPVALTGIGMNIFYQFGSTFDSDVPGCFDLVPASVGKPGSGCLTPPPGDTPTMGYETADYGCKLSSTASVLSTFADSLSATTPESLDMNPPAVGADPEKGLYEPLGSGDLYSHDLPNYRESCDVESGIVGGGCSSVPSGTTLDGYLSQHITNLDPVILKLCPSASGGTCPNSTHFVTVVAPSGSDWVLFDPGWRVANEAPNYLLSGHTTGFYTTTTNSDGNTTQVFRKFAVAGVITFSRAASVLSSLAISAYSPVEFLVTDSQGRRVGNVATGEDVSEIPQSSYSRDFPIADDNGNNPPLGDPTGIKTAYIPNPAAGSYQLQVTGTASGTFTLTFAFVATDGSIQSTSFSGITDAGARQSYQLQYSPTPGKVPQPTPVASSFVFTGAAPASGTACNGAYNGIFAGNLTVSAGQTCIFVGGGVTGNITQTGGDLALIASTAYGNMQVQGGGAFFLSGSASIQGNLQIQNLPASSIQNQVCGVNVKGNLTYQNNAAPIEIGGASMCPGNKVGGNLQIQDNAAAVEMFGNTVTGNLQDQDNTASTQVAGNAVGGNLQIQNNTAAVTVVSNAVANNLQCEGNTTITGNSNTARQKQGQCAGF